MNTEIVSESDKVDLAKAYVALSNAHRLQFIVPMFADNASYHSANVGVFNGRKAIGSMMTSFFNRFPDVYWKVRDYRCTTKGSVEFDLEMSAIETATGEHIRRAGIEEIEFTCNGFIARLEVR